MPKFALGALAFAVSLLAMSASRAQTSSLPSGDKVGTFSTTGVTTATRYYRCWGSTKRRTSAGDVTDTIFYGIITSGRDDIDAARNLFRQQMGTRGVANTEDHGTSCNGYSTRAEAEAAKSEKIARDSRGGWRQVTNIELTM